MYSYNLAFNYLCNKYGKVFLSYTYKNEKAMRSMNIKDKEAFKMNATDADKIYTYDKSKILDHSDKSIDLLLSQYSLGIEPKKELYIIMKSK